MPYNTEKKRLACKSKHNFKHKNQLVLLMVTNGKKLHYLPLSMAISKTFVSIA